MNHIPSASRRALLKTMGAGAIGLLAAACATSPAAGPSGSNATAAAPVGTPAPAVSSPSSPARSSAPAASPAAAASAAPAQSGGAQVVTYGEVKALGDIPVYAAMEQGYFADQGIQIKLQTFDSAANMVAPLGAGQLDTGGGPASAGLFNALARGIPIKAVADKGHSDATPPGFPVSIFLVRKALVTGGQVKSVADLKGRKVGWVARGIASELDLAALLKTGGLTVKDIDFALMGFPDMVAAFASGAIDMAGPPEPIATTLLKQGTASLLKYDYQVNPTNQVGAILYGSKFAGSPVATRWMVAYIRACRLYNDAFVKKDASAKQKIVSAAVKYTTVKDPAVYNQITYNALYPDGSLDVKSIQTQQDYYVSQGLQQARVDLNKAIDLHYAQDAVKQLGPYHA